MQAVVIRLDATWQTQRRRVLCNVNWGPEEQSEMSGKAMWWAFDKAKDKATNRIVRFGAGLDGTRWII